MVGQNRIQQFLVQTQCNTRKCLITLLTFVFIRHSCDFLRTSQTPPARLSQPPVTGGTSHMTRQSSFLEIGHKNKKRKKITFPSRIFYNRNFLLREQVNSQFSTKMYSEPPRDQTGCYTFEKY